MTAAHEAAPGGLPTDLSVLAAAAGIENLLVAGYSAVLGLAAAQGAEPSVLAFVTATRGRHADHLAALNAAATGAGGGPTTVPDAAALTRVRDALPALGSAAQVLAFLAELEDAAARIYVRGVPVVGEAALRTLLVTIGGVESQHGAVLRTFAALLRAGLPVSALTTGPMTAPAAVGTVGVGDAFAPTAPSALTVPTVPTAPSTGTAGP